MNSKRIAYKNGIKLTGVHSYKVFVVMITALHRLLGEILVITPGEVMGDGTTDGVIKTGIHNLIWIQVGF